MSGGSDSQTVSQVTQRPAYEQAALSKLYRNAENLYQNYSPEYFPESTVAPLSRDTQTAMNAMRAIPGSDFSRAVLQASRQATDAAGSMVGGPDLFSAADQGVARYGIENPGQNPITENLVNRSIRAATEDFNRSILPQIQSNQAANNSYGGTRGALSEGIAAADARESNLDMASRIYESALARDQAQNMQAAALGGQLGQQEFTGAQNAIRTVGQMAPGMLQLQYQNLEPLLRSGQIDQAYRDAVLADEVNRWNFTQEQPYRAQREYAATIAGLPSGGGTTSTTSPGPQTGGLAAGIGGAAAGAGLAGTLGSAIPAIAGGPLTLGLAGLGALAGFL